MKNKRRLGRKLLSAVLFFVLVLSLMPEMSLTVKAEDIPKNTGGVWVGTTNLTDGGSVSGSTGTATFDKDTHTLTLDNFESIGTIHEYGPESGAWSSKATISVYRYNHDVTIIFKGSNRLIASDGNAIVVSPDTSKKCTIKGDNDSASLNVTGVSNGFSTNCNLRILRGNIRCTGTNNYGINVSNSSTEDDNEATIISGGNVTCIGKESGFASTGYLSVTGGTMQAWSTTAGGNKRGINCSLIRLGDGIDGLQSEDSLDWVPLDEVSGGYKVSKKCARIIAASYSVIYDGNGATSGTVPTDMTSYSSGTTVTVLGNTGNLAKTDKSFGGWNTNADGTGTNYVENETFEINENIILYARWLDSSQATVSENAITLVVKNKSSITKLFSKYGESGYKYRFKVEDKAQRKIARVTRKGKIRVKRSGKVKVSLFRKVKGGVWSKIEEQEIKTEKPIVKTKVTDLKVGDTLEASSFITNQKDLVNKPTSYVSTNTKVATVESKTGKIKILKKGSTKIKMIYGAEKGAAVYKTRLKVNQ